jgi:adenine phosphoribosyltransferase
MNEEIKAKIRAIPNWPKDGIMFRDITTLIGDPQGFKDTCDILYEEFKDKDIDIIAGIESRGFIFGAVLAYLLNKSFVPIRKPGKLPAECICMEYELEYGTDKIEVHKDAIEEGDKVLIADDLLATGGTMKAACQLVESLGGDVVGCAFVVELTDLKGRDKLEGYKLFKLVDFEGE